METLFPQESSVSRQHDTDACNESFWHQDGQLTLSEAYARFQSICQIDNTTPLPFIVRFMENPRPLFEFSGAITLYQHDLVHCLIGRGITLQDEAFTIGFTMGSDKRLKSAEVALFKFVAQQLYPKDFRFAKSDVSIFMSGVNMARQMSRLQALNKFRTADYLSVRLSDVRQQLGVETSGLAYTLGVA